MYSRPEIFLKYLHHFFSASSNKGHGVHSPFVFEFITKVMNDKTIYPEYLKTEELRRQLKKDRTLLTIEDFGAGSVIAKTNKRTVSSITKHAAKPGKLGQLLFRMVKYYQPGVIVELGTSLGITTSYLSLARPKAKLITMEGARSIAEVARKNFHSMSLGNVELVEGNFDEILSQVIQPLNTVDFAFIDGNHRQEPTERYFQQLLEKANNQSVFVFDDIHWSREMEAAWISVKNHPAVTCSIDLFFLGVVFFRKEFKEKQHFSIRI